MEEWLTVLKRLIPPRAARPKDFLFYGKRIWLQEKGVVRCVIANSLKISAHFMCVELGGKSKRGPKDEDNSMGQDNGKIS